MEEGVQYPAIETQLEPAQIVMKTVAHITDNLQYRTYAKLRQNKYSLLNQWYLVRQMNHELGINHLVHYK